MHSKYEIFTKRKLLRGNTITSATSSSTQSSNISKSMSFSALLAKSDSNENILVDISDNKSPESYILIDNDLDKQNEVEVDTEVAPIAGAESNVEQVPNIRNNLPPMNQVK